jgi:cytochrome c
MKNAEKIGAVIAMLMTASATPSYAQDVEHGKTVFKACAACHATDHVNRVGPGLGGIIGRKSGDVAGFRYSTAMKNYGVIWDDKLLNAYLESPQKAVPGNRMPYAGLKDETARADLIGYLATLK